MTERQSVTRPEVLRGVVAVLAFGGVFLLLWGASAEQVGPLVLAVALWVVGGLLSFGIDETGYSDPNEVWRPNSGQREPTAEGATGPADRTSADELEQLRERYARGEVTEAEFERRVERLLATDGVSADDDAVRTLRERYARGDLSDEQFDRKLDRLTETRTLEDATDAYERERSTEESH